jgi:hypothetical protein
MPSATEGARSRPASSPCPSVVSTFAGRMGGVRSHSEGGIRGEHGVRLNSGLGLPGPPLFLPFPNERANVSGWAGGSGRRPTGSANEGSAPGCMLECCAAAFRMGRGGLGLTASARSFGGMRDEGLVEVAIRRRKWTGNRCRGLGKAVAIGIRVPAALPALTIVLQSVGAVRKDSPVPGKPRQARAERPIRLARLNPG